MIHFEVEFPENKNKTIINKLKRICGRGPVKQYFIPLGDPILDYTYAVGRRVCNLLSLHVEVEVVVKVIFVNSYSDVEGLKPESIPQGNPRAITITTRRNKSITIVCLISKLTPFVLAHEVAHAVIFNNLPKASVEVHEVLAVWVDKNFMNNVVNYG